MEEVAGVGVESLFPEVVAGGVIGVLLSESLKSTGVW